MQKFAKRVPPIGLGCTVEKLRIPHLKVSQLENLRSLWQYLCKIKVRKQCFLVVPVPYRGLLEKDSPMPHMNGIDKAGIVMYMI